MAEEIINQEETPAVEEVVEVKAEVAVAEAKVAAEDTPERKPHKRVLQGKVVSDKGNKTIVVKWERQIAHPLYKKYYKRSKKVLAHDENNDCRAGDTVRIKESRPLSARKRWVLIDILERAK